MNDIIAHLRVVAQNLLDLAAVLEQLVAEDEHIEEDTRKRRPSPTPLSVIVGGKT